MTIRQYIKQRSRWGLLGFVTFSVVTLLLSFDKQGTLAVVAGTVGSMAGLAAYVSVFFLRCPKCKANIGTSIVVPTAFRLFGREVKYCPYCAVNLDDPMP